MKWFKHLVRSKSDPTILESEVLFKTQGPYVYWRLIEILADENAIDTPFITNFKVFKMWFPSVTVNKLITILIFFRDKNKIIFKISDEKIIISSNKLCEISSDYAAKVQRMSEVTPKKLSKTSTLDLDLDIEKEKAYKPVYDYYLSLPLMKHKKYTSSMATAIKSFMKKTKCSTDDCCRLLDKHVVAVETTKNNTHPIRLRGITEFFGQKVHNGTELIGEQYMDGGKFSVIKKKPEKSKFGNGVVF